MPSPELQLLLNAETASWEAVFAWAGGAWAGGAWAGGAWAGGGRWLAWGLASALGLGVLLWRWCVSCGVRARRGGRWPARLAGDAGTATVEFALVFPVLLVMVLLLIQTALAFSGQMFVHYAAFAAARRAIVEVPRDLGGEGRNAVAAQSSQKRENIRGVAAFAMLPVSGPGAGTGSLGASRPVGTAVDALYAAEGLDTPRWSEDLVDRRMAYALAHTDVRLFRLKQSTDAADAATRITVSPTGAGGAAVGGWRYGPRDPVGVTVRHRFHLSVPYVGRLLGDGTHEVDETTWAYAMLEGEFVLSNEGVWRELPEPSKHPRVDWNAP